MNQIAENITRDLLTKNNKNRILSPKKGSLVFYKNDNGEFVPVKILDGQFYSNGRLSNFWEWENLATGEKESGYGDFYKDNTK